jgi:hypothetical protein
MKAGFVSLTLVRRTLGLCLALMMMAGLLGCGHVEIRFENPPARENSGAIDSLAASTVAAGGDETAPAAAGSVTASSPAAATATLAPSTRTPTGSAGVTPTPTAAPEGEEPEPTDGEPALVSPRAVTGLREPLLVDGEKGWVLALGQVEGVSRTVKLATEDGGLLDVYAPTGRLALDRSANRLIVDPGGSQVAVLDAESGEDLRRIDLPTGGPALADPQADPTSGEVFVFRGRSMYVLDAATGSVVGQVDLAVTISSCGDPQGNAEIRASQYDLVNNRLYLTFVTYTCTPWVTQTIVAYDGESWDEMGRYDTTHQYQAVPYSDSLYGTSLFRLGRHISWAWNGRQVWFEESYDGWVTLQGIVADWGRGLVYEALDGGLRVYRAFPREELRHVDLGSKLGLPQGARLAGHDPISDNLFFIVDGRLEVRPAQAIFQD